MLVRPALPVEAARLSAIAWLAKAWHGYAPAQLALWRDELTITPRSIAAHPTFAAVTDTGLIGFCQADLTSLDAQLTHLWVDPDAMRQGAGRALLAAAASAAAERGFARLTIDADPGAEVFYHGCGAHTVARLPAPIPGDPGRTRPQMVLPFGRPGLTVQGAVR